MSLKPFTAVTVFQTIWNCIEHFENNAVFLNIVSKECILTVFEKIWNCRYPLKTMFLKPASERIVTAEKNENKDGKLCIVAVFETAWNCRKNNENKGGKWCMLMVFEKDLELYVKTCESPPWPLLFWLSGISCRPGPTSSYASASKLRF